SRGRRRPRDDRAKIGDRVRREGQTRDRRRRRTDPCDGEHSAMTSEDIEEIGEKLRVMIADDEMIARKRLHRLLSVLPDVEIVAECEDGDAVLARAKEGDIDVVFLDVEMPKLTGVEAMALLPPDDPAIVCVTAH